MKYAVGDLVMFRNRCQWTTGGMRISKVHEAPLLGEEYTRYELDSGPYGALWIAECFVPFEEWKNKHTAA